MAAYDVLKFGKNRNYVTFAVHSSLPQYILPPYRARTVMLIVLPITPYITLQSAASELSRLCSGRCRCTRQCVWQAIYELFVLQLLHAVQTARKCVNACTRPLLTVRWRSASAFVDNCPTCSRSTSLFRLPFLDNAERWLVFVRVLKCFW